MSDKKPLELRVSVDVGYRRHSVAIGLPSGEVPRRVRVRSSDRGIRRILSRIEKPARIRVPEKLKKECLVKIEIHEGCKREVRRMFEVLGYFVEKLTRVRVGNVEWAGSRRARFAP